MLNELPNATAVLTVAARATTPYAAFYKKCEPAVQSADQLSEQPTDSDKSKVPNAMCLFRAKLHKTVFVNIAKPELTIAGFIQLNR